MGALWHGRGSARCPRLVPLLGPGGATSLARLMESLDLLLEIGVEELPSSFVDAALAALPDLVAKRLSALRLAHGPIRALGTPRRLAVLVASVASAQPDLAEELTGPPVSAAFDKEGKATKAGEAFAKKLGVDVSALASIDTPKGKYLAGTRREKGRPASELLGAMLAAICGEIPFRKSMRWGDGDQAFGRPIRTLVALYGSSVIDFEFAGARSGRTTHGHRFLAPDAIELASTAGYVETLAKAHVLVDPAARMAEMKARLDEGAREAGGTLVDDAFLMRENASLVEEPRVVVGSFEDRFRALPDAVILEVARGHQRYFGVRGADGRLLPRYLAVVNTALRPDLIVKGNDRVMRARLSDAQFFFDEDRKAKLETRLDKLAGIVFHNRLGSVRDKVVRVEKLVASIGERLSGRVDVAIATRGATLAKCDLVTLMVGEFPDLQGSMGRAYALAGGETPAVAEVIAEHYQPKGAKDDVAPSPEGALVALADRLDTLVGCFAVGLSPTGAADPYALRRACLGVLRTMLHHGWDLSLDELFRAAHRGLAGLKLELDENKTAQKLADFTRERLKNLLADAVPTDVVDACLAVTADRPVDAFTRAAALATLDAGVRAKVGEVFKRVANIAKDAPAGAPVAPSEREASPHASEVALWEGLSSLRGVLDTSTDAHDFDAAFRAIGAFAPTLADYFGAVFVMTEDVPLRENRLRTLRAVRDACSTVAHFQLLAG